MSSRIGRLARRARDAGRYRTAPAQSLRYVGWIGHQNLGDEALLLAVQRLFDPARMVTEEQPQHRLLRRVTERSFAGTIIGGGTLLLEPYYLNLIPAVPHRGRLVVFGTGAPLIDGPPSEVEAWSTVLADAAYIGVRGTRTRDVLADHGIRSEVIGDLACSVPKATASVSVGPPGRPGPPVIALNVTRLAEYPDSLRRWSVVATTLQRRGFGVRIIVASPDDLTMSQQLAAAASLGDDAVVSVLGSVRRFEHALEGVLAVVAMRLHVGALAITMADIPAHLAATRPKCAEWMESVGTPTYLFDPVDFDPVDLASTTADLAADPAPFLAASLPKIAHFQQLQSSRAEACRRQLTDTRTGRAR